MTEDRSPSRTPRAVAGRRGVFHGVLAALALAVGGLASRRAPAARRSGPVEEGRLAPRRVVTGETPAGRSFIVSDQRLASNRVSGIDLFPIWGVDRIPVALPTDGMAAPGPARGEGVVRTALGVIPPRTLVGEGKGGGGLQFDARGFHQTNSLDVAVVMSGEITLRVPDEKDVRLRPGDCIVQNGALHAWENETDAPATILWVWVKGERAG